MRQKVISKNLQQPFWKFYKEKNIQIFNNGGWHFNSLLKPEDISLKLKTFAHIEFRSDEFSNVDVIKKNISENKDLFKRDRYYKKVELDQSFPDFIEKIKIYLVNGYYNICLSIFLKTEISILISPTVLIFLSISLFNLIF